MKPSSQKIYFFSLIILYLLIRLVILVTSENIYHNEERYVGTIAKELVEGPHWPLFDYQQNVYEGRTLISGIMVVPFFLVFGQSVLSMKLLGITCGLVNLILFTLFLNRYFGYRAAFLGSLMYLVPPPPLVFIDAMPAITGYFLFSIVMLGLFFKLFSRKEGERFLLMPANSDEKPARYFIFLGLASGFFVYLHIMFFFAILPYVLLWYFLDRAFFLRRSFVYFLASFATGVAPCIYYNITRGFRFSGLAIRGRSLFNYVDVMNFPENFRALLARSDQLFQFYVDFPFPSAFSNVFFYVLILASVCFLIWHNRKTRQRGAIAPETIFMVYPVLYFLFLSFFNTRRGNDTFDYVLLYPFVFMIITLFLTRLFEMKKYLIPMTIVPVLVCILTANVFGFVSFKSPSEIRSQHVKPYSYEGLVVNLFIKYYWQDPRRCADYVRRLGEENKAACDRGIRAFFRIFFPASDKDRWSSVRKEFHYEGRTWGF